MPAPIESDEMLYVLDGGSLLYRLPWPRGSTFGNVCQLYVDYVKKFRCPVIVFDGYTSGPTTKDVTHLRRSDGVVGVEVNFDANMVISCKKEVFLSNSANKQKFVYMLGNYLEKSGCTVVHAEADADLCISQTAIQSAANGPTTVIGEDTDLLVLLCYHADKDSSPIYLWSDKKSTKKMRIWDIHWIQKGLGPDLCSLLPFIHAVAGCDTTSRLFGIGKSLPLQKAKTNPHFKQQALVFMDTVPKMDIYQAGEKALVCLYGGTTEQGLDELRYQRFCEKVYASASPVQVKTLPPTSAAAHQHSARVYYQVHEWMGEQDKDPKNWGWKEVQGCLRPHMTDLATAPEELLRVIKCNCKGDCNSRKCTCRKHGLDCTIACGECKGISCINVSELYVDNVQDEA